MQRKERRNILCICTHTHTYTHTTHTHTHTHIHTHTHTNTQADIFFAGEKAKAASVSIMHSVPLVSGRHMEMLAMVILAANAYYVSVARSLWV